MKVLIVHNGYQHAGGEDSAVRNEAKMLRTNGVTVEIYQRTNDDIRSASKAEVAMEAVWSTRTSREIAQKIADLRPDVVHAHNTFPLVSPSLYYAASRAGVPVVQTLHNFRLACPQAMFLRNGRICEDCVGKLPWRSVVHGCYRESRGQSAVVAAMLGFHRAMGTYDKRVNRYIALNEFCRGKFIEAGLPGDRIAVKPNFVDIPAYAHPGLRSGPLFVGRLSPEKGISVLADVARTRPGAPSIRVIGDGPERGVLAAAPLHLVGQVTPSEVHDWMRSSSYLVVPSIWYETFGLVILEAFACSTPVIASNLGAMRELVKDHETGLLCEPGNSEDLANKMRWADEHPEEMRKMGERARRVYEKSYSAAANFAQLVAIYRECIAEVSVQSDHLRRRGGMDGASDER
jgi:glycosyltransferase involved in cell wall biosynthesis